MSKPSLVGLTRFDGHPLIRGTAPGRMSIMETREPKQPRARRSLTPQFKAEIVELCQGGDRSIGQVARDVDLTETAVREWVRQAERDAGRRGDGGLTNAERQNCRPCAGRPNGYGRTWRSSSERRLAS
jgi:transposase